MIQIKQNNGEITEEIINDFWKLKTFKKIKNENQAERADWIDQTCKLVNRPYPQIASLLFKYPTSWIHQMYDDAMAFTKNPPARWWQIYKQSKIK